MILILRILKVKKNLEVKCYVLNLEISIIVLLQAYLTLSSVLSAGTLLLNEMSRQKYTLARRYAQLIFGLSNSQSLVSLLLLRSNETNDIEKKINIETVSPE